MGEKKQIAYYYDGQFKNEDTEVDPDGELAVPKKNRLSKSTGRRGG